MQKATLGMNYRTLSAHLERMSGKMLDLRQQAATGKKINRPSDDPGAIRPVLHYRIQTASTERYANHISMAKGEMEVLDSSLDQLENILVSAKETGIAVINGSVNDADRATYADQISQLYDEMMQVANTQNSEKYVFSGYEESTRPFTENAGYDPALYDPANEATWAVSYHGDANAKSLEIAPGKKVQTGLTGRELFLGDADSDGAVDAGAVDLFSLLKDFEHAIRSNDEAALSTGLDRLEQGAEQVRRLRGRMGNNAWRIERAGRHMDDAAIEFKEIISGYEDADALKVFSDLVQHETAFEAALNVTTRVSRLSILDFM
jgi:flagellar hook-associated protein 3 FlgL